MESALAKRDFVTDTPGWVLCPVHAGAAARLNPRPKLQMDAVVSITRVVRGNLRPAPPDRRTQIGSAFCFGTLRLWFDQLDHGRDAAHSIWTEAAQVAHHPCHLRSISRGRLLVRVQAGQRIHCSYRAPGPAGRGTTPRVRAFRAPFGRWSPERYRPLLPRTPA